ncbi:hypothetical protein [Sulfurisphaera tokodaii]|uniref:DUF1102 domain-containing protein n=2 Tax=Sulfurisphaera tokodaii TaxID=111955 RepID=Q970P5_SULTO|nr:hypothetical protein [Sulfurisphaera tokodaii]BAB66628.1 hypothetical protein STK_15550 [Sulfurisphaera tokodaii str. 7]HII73552.1 hypothetical protein [Sulfurisphaera tokodaii]
MQNTTKALIIGTVLGILLISFVASMTFYYTTQPRDVDATVVGDASANIALIANDTAIGYSSTGSPFVTYNSQGDLVINFGNVATNANETLKYLFDVKNNLNVTVSVTVTIPSPTISGNSLYIFTPSGGVSTYSFTLAPGAEMPISLELLTGGTQGSVSFSIVVEATAVPPSS